MFVRFIGFLSDILTWHENSIVPDESGISEHIPINFTCNALSYDSNFNKI